MKVLSLSTDQKIFEDGSAVRARQEAYAQHIGEMYVIVLAGGPVPREVVFGTARAVTTTGPRILAGFAAWLIARRIEKPDVVTVQDPFENGLAAWWIARSLGVPLHVQVHTDFTARGFRRHALRNRLRTYIAWFVLRRASRVRVVLDRTRDDLVRHGITAPVSVLPIYVDVGRLAQLPREKHPKWKIDFLFIGRLESEKHPCLAIDVLRAVRKAGHDVGLTVVGEGSEHAFLAERARRYNLSTRVEFVGWQHDTARYLSRADLVLVPSRYEGYGMVIVEALAAGVPVVATDVGVAREAGAIVSSERHFARDVLAWVADGPRQGDLQNYPYSTFDEYVERWCADILLATAAV